MTDPRITEALSHLGAALAQALPSDDETIMGHVREARRLLRAAADSDVAPARGREWAEGVCR